MKTQIEYLAIDALIPYARNSRTHDDAQEFTGKKATHAATGATFDEVAADQPLAVEETA